MRILLAVTLGFLLFVPCETLKAHDFEWRNLVLASLKLRTGVDYDAFVDSYIEVYRPEVWKKFRNDEFEMAEKRKESIAQMKEAIANFSLQETFQFNTSTKFGNYDFTAKAFPIDGFSETSYFFDREYPHASFPDQILVYLTNPRVVSRMPMGEAQAKEFLRSRKDRSGEVDRFVYLSLAIKISKFKLAPDELLADIVSFKVYADQGYRTLLYEFAPPKLALRDEKAQPAPQKPAPAKQVSKSK